MSDRLLSLLGLCRKAGRLGWGHDACMTSIKDGTAQLCLLACDASDRLKGEFLRAVQFKGHPPAIETQYTTEQIRQATGRRAAVLTINDEGFAKKAAELHQSLISGGIANDK